MNLEQYIDKAQAKELTGSDIDRMLRGQAPILPYSSLERYDNIDDVLGPNSCAVFLYEMIPKQGHWVCMFRDQNGQLIFYDSLGYKMDDELNFVNKYRKDEDLPKFSKELTRLTSPEKVVSNTLPIQEDEENISTCGRYCVMRLLLRDLSNDDFNRIFTGDDDYSPDFFITLITSMM